MTNVNGNYKKKLKKTFKKISKKTTVEQRFLGKTLPKAIGGLAKFAFKRPVTTLALTGLYKGAKALGTKFGTKYNFSQVRQFDKKGRKII